MKILKTFKQCRDFIEHAKSAQTPLAHAKSVGFVPTMGALHAGHLSLVERSLSENDLTVVSIFVNPTQFNDPKDLKEYPVTWEQDLALLAGAKGADTGKRVDAIVAPSEHDLYPDSYRYSVDESEDSRMLCGAHRPGHFRGVLTVVMKLFQWVRPTRAYFGEKDFQQLRLIQGMVDAFFMDIQVVPCPIVRAGDGLALSSRNLRLSPAERERAPAFARALKDSSTLKEAKEKMETAGLRVDYIEERWGRRLAAAHLGNVRLIDNVEKTDSA